MGVLLTEGLQSQKVADVLAAILCAVHRPATQILQELSGRKLAIDILRDGERNLTSDEAGWLDASGLARCRWRHGLLRADDGLIAASTTLVWLPARLPFDTCRELDAGDEPAGVILGRLGMRRTWRRALATTVAEEIAGRPAAVHSAAVLMVGAAKVGLSEEQITREFTESLT